MTEPQHGDISYRWMAQVVDYRQSVDLMHIRTIFGESKAFAMPMKFVYEEGAPIIYREPTLVLQFCEAKQLMQALWDAGVRPENGIASTAVTDAMQAHVKLAESVIDRTFQLLDHQKDSRAIAAGMAMVQPTSLMER